MKYIYKDNVDTLKLSVERCLQGNNNNTVVSALMCHVSPYKTMLCQMVYILKKHGWSRPLQTRRLCSPSSIKTKIGSWNNNHKSLVRQLPGSLENATANKPVAVLGTFTLEQSWLGSRRAGGGSCGPLTGAPKGLLPSPRG